MADIDKVDGRFQARWRDETGRQRAKRFPTRRAAEDFLAGLRTSRMQGKPSSPPPRRAAQQVRDYARFHWLPKMQHLSPNSRLLYEGHLRNHIAPSALGRTRIGEVTPDDVELFLAGLAGRLAPSTVHVTHAVLHRMFRSAVRAGLIASNPAEDVSLPRLEKKHWDPLPADAIMKLADAIHPRYRVAVWLAAGAGLREGECLGLLTSRVRFLERKIEVRQQLQNGVLCELKTRASRRAVPVDDLVLAEIARHLEQWPSDHLLITTQHGGPVSRSLFGKHWRAAAQRAGLPGETFHSLRHWYASTLIAAGLSVRLVQDRLGHSSAVMTLNVYSHLWPADAELGRGVVESMFTRAAHLHESTN
jgi:integrase